MADEQTCADAAKDKIDDTVLSKSEAAPPSPPVFDIVYENEEMVVVNKPNDVPMDGEGFPYTVEQWANDYLDGRRRASLHEEASPLGSTPSPSPVTGASAAPGDGKRRVKFVHQLDYATSGVLCLAFTKPMAARLAHSFEMRTSRKYYLAVVHGHVPLTSSACAAAWLASLPTHARGRSRGAEGDDTLSGACSSDAGRLVGDYGVHLRDPRRSAQCAGWDTGVYAGGNTAPPFSSAEKEREPVWRRHGLVGEVLEQYARIFRTARAADVFIEVNLPIGYDPSDPKHFRMAVVTGAEGRPSLTHVVPLQHAFWAHPRTQEPCPVTKVLLLPRTGRRHQLRVHCHAIGFPIVGDVLYASGNSAVAVTPVTSALAAEGWPRMHLHAWRLCLPGSVECVTDRILQAQQRRKRRREAKMIEDAAQNSAEEGEWTEFVTRDPFEL